MARPAPQFLSRYNSRRNPDFSVRTANLVVVSLFESRADKAPQGVDTIHMYDVAVGKC